MFESRDNMPPVATERSMIAIVENEDVPVRAAWAGDARQPSD